MFKNKNLQQYPPRETENTFYHPLINMVPSMFHKNVSPNNHLNHDQGSRKAFKNHSRDISLECDEVLKMSPSTEDDLVCNEELDFCKEPTGAPRERSKEKKVEEKIPQRDRHREQPEGDARNEEILLRVQSVLQNFQEKLSQKDMEINRLQETEIHLKSEVNRLNTYIKKL